MSKLEVIKKSVVKATGRTGLLIKKHSPEILITVGIVGVVSSAVLACRATLKVEGIIEKSKENLDRIHEVRDSVTCEDPSEYVDEEGNAVEYTEKKYKQDLAVVYARTGMEFVKLYAPSVTLGAISIACLLSAHNILKKRNLALMAAYKAIEQSFTDYRKRVVEEFGENKDRQFKLGIREEKIDDVEIDENGKKKKVKKTVETVDPSVVSQYARFFDEWSTEWSKTPEYNLSFLTMAQNQANDLLKTRGHVFLNEIYDMIGVPRSQAGAVVGWVNGEGDDYIDFGIFNGDNMATRDFVNGYERSILLDFNVQGVIYDLI